MDASFWFDRWREGRIGFHEGRPNRFLERHHARLGERRRVLVPLCGKADDLAYLAGLGHEVVGVELVEDAVRAFFAEHGLTPTVERGVYRAGAVTIVAGDFFATSRAVLGAVDALYDRAALIALPPDLRPRYAAHVRGLLPAGAPGLIVTLEYPPGHLDGPPFSVLEAELRALYPELPIEALDRADDPRRGAPVEERCFAIRF